MALLQDETNFFGIDLGSTGVRLVQLKKTGAKPALVAYGGVDVPFGLLTSDAPTDMDQLAGVIRDLVKSTRVSTKNVVAGLPSANAFAAVISTPKVSAQELEKAIKWQAEKYIPMALDQVKIDWFVIGPGANANEIDVLLVAAPNTVTEKYLRIFEKAGLELMALEINAIALARSLVTNPDLAVAVVDIGGLSSDLTIVHARTPKLVRSAPVGYRTFVRSVAQNLGLDEPQAEQFMVKFGLTQTKLEGQVLKSLKSALDNLLDELIKSAKFFQEQNPTIKLEKVIITGPAAALPELPAYIATRTGLAIEIGNPWVGVAFNSGLQEQLSANALAYATAVGLAMRNM